MSHQDLEVAAGRDYSRGLAAAVETAATELPHPNPKPHIGSAIQLQNLDTRRFQLREVVRPWPSVVSQLGRWSEEGTEKDPRC
jgi:hypothetical protein